MLNLLLAVLSTARSSLQSRRELVLENLALRQQLAVLGRRAKRPMLTRGDRAFWIALSRLWPRWQSALMLVKPATVIGWHRKGFALYWTWKSRRRRGGRPRKDPEIRALIRQMAADNVGWGAPRIHGELLKLGFEVSQSTVSRSMPRTNKPPSQTWRTFLTNHMHCAAAIDFFVVPTVTLGLLYVFVVLEHARETQLVCVFQSARVGTNGAGGREHDGLAGHCAFDLAAGSGHSLLPAHRMDHAPPELAGG